MAHTALTNEKYLELSERTMANNFYLSTPTLINLLHGAIGIQTEIGEIMEAFSEVEPEFADEEVDAVNLVEECGDVLWYGAIFQRELDIVYSDLKIQHLPFDIEYFSTVLELMTISSSYLLDSIKKRAFYNKPMDIELVKLNLSKVYSGILWLLFNFGEKTFQECMAININKLEKRFPDKFTNDHANFRNLEVERAVLKGVN